MGLSETTVDEVNNLSIEDCRRELTNETDLKKMRALVSASRLLDKMKRRQLTGKLEMDVQAGNVRRINVPDYIQLT